MVSRSQCCQNSFAVVLFLFLASAVGPGCSSLKTREQVSKDSRPARAQPETARPGAMPTPPPIVTSQPTPEDSGADALPIQASPSPVPTPPISTPQPGDTFLNRELPKIGLILGPGGLKTYAHVGVLREFARARIPIHAIAGLEWGAFMAAAYSEKAMANDVDWKAFRLRESDLPTSGVLRGYRAISLEDFDSFLKTVFPSGSAEKGRVPFGCPAVWKRDRFQWQATGYIKEVVARCLPFPPLVSGTKGFTAAADALEESAHWLRSKGATLVILVNVLGSGETLGEKLAEDQYGTSVLWTEIRRQLLKARAPVVNWVVSVNTTGQKIDDFEARRASVEMGAKSAEDLTTKLTKQYGF
jgi:NTE family protein